MEPERLIAKVECRDAGDGPVLHGVLIQEGRAATGGRSEVFAPGAIRWPHDGVGVQLQHLTPPVVRAFPERCDNGEIRIATPATPELRAAVSGGKRFMSVEFIATDASRTRGGVREIRQAIVYGVTLTNNPEYAQARAEVRDRRRTAKAWL